MLCQRCHKDKLESEMQGKEPYCHACRIKMRAQNYRDTHKEEIKSYYKQWYKKKGKKLRKQKIKKDFSKRNKRIYEIYMDPNKHYSTKSLANLFHISQRRVVQIIKNEQKKG